MKTFGRVNRATRAQERRGWYRITNAAGDGARPAQVHLFDEIGYWGTSAAMFIDELRAVTAGDIELRVNSPGGEIFEGYAIYNALASHPANVTAYVDGLAASAASFIVQAADSIIMKETSQMMIHDGIGFVFDNANGMREQADLLDKLSGQIAEIYAARTGVPAADWRTAMLAETWYTAQEAVDAGLADEVEPMRRRGEGGSTNSAAAAHDALSQLWDLSPFRYAGREAAPAPAIARASRRAPESVAIEPAPAALANADGLLGWLLDHSEPVTVNDTDPLAALRG
jgi:ATP-dependent protease ClpP protease subunit